MSPIKHEVLVSERTNTLRIEIKNSILSVLKNYDQKVNPLSSEFKIGQNLRTIQAA